MVLTVTTPLFGEAVFKNFQLNVAEQIHKKLEIYPNPANSTVHIAHNSPIYTIEIFNSIGQSLKRIKSYPERIDISNFTNGIYFFKITTDAGSTYQKIIKD